MIELPGQINHSMYLASPYTDTEPRVMNQRHRDVCKVAGEMMRAGKIIFCPVSHFHEIGRICKMQVDWSVWRKQCLHWVGLCDEFGILQLPGFSSSVGMCAENQFAMDLGKPIHYVDATPWLEKKT